MGAAVLSLLEVYSVRERDVRGFWRACSMLSALITSLVVVGGADL